MFNVLIFIIGAAIGEWLGAKSGLGYFSRRMMTQLDGAGVFAPIVLLSAAAILAVHRRRPRRVLSTQPTLTTRSSSSSSCSHSSTVMAAPPCSDSAG